MALNSTKAIAEKLAPKSGCQDWRDAVEHYGGADPNAGKACCPSYIGQRPCKETNAGVESLPGAVMFLDRGEIGKGRRK